MSRPRLALRPALQLLSAALLLMAVPAQAARLAKDIVPTSQEVRLVLDADQPTYTGQTTIHLEAKQPVTTFQFHAENMQFSSLVLKDASGTAVSATHAMGEHELVTVTTVEPLNTGAYTMDIDFQTSFNTQAVALYRMDHEGAGYSFTQLEPDDARGAFPCWDEPEFKIPYQLTIQVPEAHIAVSNTPIKQETVENGLRTYAFQQTKPLPSYLIAIATGPLETATIYGAGIPGKIYTVKGQKHLTTLAIEMTPKILTALEAWFGSRYPYEKLDYIAIPEFWPGAMENPGAVTFADQVLLLDSKTATLQEKRLLANIITHELAHMWYGNLVTMTWWNDLWLNESFADWMGDKIANEVYPQYELDLSSLQDGQEILSVDARPSTPAIRRDVESTDNLFSDIGLAYSKGKTVLSMFERWIGPDVFRDGVRAYIEAHKWGSAEATDLWAALDKASGKNVSAAIASYIEQPGFPVIEVEPQGSNKVRLTQERFHNHGVKVDDLQWKTPVTLKYAHQGGVHTETVLLESKSQIVTLQADGELAWIYPNAGGNGYYRWNIPASMTVSLSSQVVEALTPAERVEFIGNASALLDAGEISGESYLRVLNGFASDPEPMVVTALLSQLDRVKTPFVPEGKEDAFAAYVRQTLGPALERFGMERKNLETETVSLLRPRLIAWLGDDGKDPKVVEHTKGLATSYLQDPASVDPALVGVSLSLGVLHGRREMFDTCKGRFESAENPADRQRFLASMGNVRDPALMDEALAYSLAGPLRANEVITIPIGLMATPAGGDRVYRWMEANYDAITKRLPPEFAAFMPYLARGCERSRLEAAKAYFADPAHSPPGTDRELAKVQDQITDCLGLREREGGSVAKYMDSFARSGP